jgi:Flp pilus assembly protein TadD
MRMRSSALLILALGACGAPAQRAPVAVAPVAPVQAPTSTQSRAPAPAPAASPELAPVPAPAPAPAALPPPRPAIIRLSSGNGDPGDSELAAGDDALAQGNVDAAEKHFMAALAQAPKSPAVAVGLARVRLARVDVPLDFGAAKGNASLAAAAADLVRVTKAAPAFGPAFVDLGRARLLLGDAPAAIDAMKRGVQLLPDEPEVHSQLGVAWLATGHADDAVRELTRAVELDPGSPARQGNLGTALIMAGRTREAIEHYEARAKADDGDPRAHSDLGTALLGTDDLQRAVAELERAVQLDPSRAAFHSNLGFALQQLGRLDRAIAEYHEALRLDPAQTSAWINLATALARNPATRPEARAALAKARALSPDDPRVKANLEELDMLEGKRKAPLK